MVFFAAMLLQDNVKKATMAVGFAMRATGNRPQPAQHGDTARQHSKTCMHACTMPYGCPGFWSC